MVVVEQPRLGIRLLARVPQVVADRRIRAVAVGNLHPGLTAVVEEGLAARGGRHFAVACDHPLPEHFSRAAGDAPGRAQVVAVDGQLGAVVDDQRHRQRPFGRGQVDVVQRVCALLLAQRLALQAQLPWAVQRAGALPLGVLLYPLGQAVVAVQALAVGVAGAGQQAARVVAQAQAALGGDGAGGVVGEGLHAAGAIDALAVAADAVVLRVEGKDEVEVGAGALGVVAVGRAGGGDEGLADRCRETKDCCTPNATLRRATA